MTPTDPSPTTRGRRRAAGALLAGAALVVLAGCGSQPAASAGAGTAAPSTPAATVVPVHMTEFALGMASTTLAAGTYTFDGADEGRAQHALAIAGPGLAPQQGPTVGPGGHSAVTVTLAPGTYELWCPVGHHKAAGMDVRLTVHG